MTNGKVVSDFTHRVLRQQPGRVLAAVGKDALKLYAVDRVPGPGTPPSAAGSSSRTIRSTRPT